MRIFASRAISCMVGLLPKVPGVSIPSGFASESNLSPSASSMIALQVVRTICLGERPKNPQFLRAAITKSITLSSEP